VIVPGGSRGIAVDDDATTGVILDLRRTGMQ
jgi:hypothetical protein